MVIDVMRMCKIFSYAVFVAKYKFMTSYLIDICNYLLFYFMLCNAGGIE